MRARGSIENNVVRVLAAVSGLSHDEVRWHWRRFVELKGAGMSDGDARVAVMREAGDTPWLAT